MFTIEGIVRGCKEKTSKKTQKLYHVLQLEGRAGKDFVRMVYVNAFGFKSFKVGESVKLPINISAGKDRAGNAVLEMFAFAEK